MENKIYIKPTQKDWPIFHMKSPVKIKNLRGSSVDAFNQELENDIRDSGDRLQGATAAKCYMTQWDMHQE